MSELKIPSPRLNTLDLGLQSAGPGKASLPFTIAKGIHGSIVRRVAEEVDLISVTRHHTRATFSLELILYNAFKCHLIQEAVGDEFRVVIKYSRDRSAYTPISRYGLDRLSFRIHMRVLQRLEGAGFICQNLSPPGAGYRSSFFPLEPLVRHLDSDGNRFEIHPTSSEVILLRGTDKQLLDYRDSPELRSMRLALQRLNALNRRWDFSVSLPLSSVEELIIVPNLATDSVVSRVYAFSDSSRFYSFAPRFSGETEEGEQRPIGQAYRRRRGKTVDDLGDGPLPYTQTVQLASVQSKPLCVYEIAAHLNHNTLRLEIPLNGLTDCRRIFSRGSWGMGGRYYCQAATLPKGLRRYLLIDSSPTLELDFNAMHPRLLYSEAGTALEGDPYGEVDLGASLEPLRTRKAVKTALLVLLNAKSKASAVGAIAAKLRGMNPPWPDTITPSALLEAVERRHGAIRKHFYADMGIKLQYRDSRVAESIFRDFVRQGRPILGLHDGFRVREEDEAFLRTTMRAAYFHECGSEPTIEKKSWDAPPRFVPNVGGQPVPSNQRGVQ